MNYSVLKEIIWSEYLYIYSISYSKNSGTNIAFLNPAFFSSL